MPSCCAPRTSPEGTDKFFSKQTKRYLKNFHKRGLAKEQRYLLEGIRPESISGKTVLEIGCGIGALHLTLLKHGGASAVGIDISEGMLQAATQLSREFGFENRVSYINGDFAAMDEQIASADVVLVDKVVCCYRDLDDLLTKSISKCTGVYALSFPRPNALVRIYFTLPIMIGTLLKWSFRPWWHDWEKMVQKIQDAGFRQVYKRDTLVWTVRVFVL
jgi:magnesium-protoporphyrin O-methyltransferase